MSQTEYDRFGPWIIEISEVDPPSPLFRPYLTRQETPLLSIKIPRNIERRKAGPDMNLYDYLISLYQHDLVILERSGESVKEHTFLYQDIQYLRYSEDLLLGKVRLGLPVTTFGLKFNTVSSSIMQRLAALIRERFCSGPEQLAMVEERPAPQDDLSYYFRGLVLKTKSRQPRFRLLAAQTNTPVISMKAAGLSNMVFRIVGKTLLESLHWSDGRELMVITRGQEYKYSWQSNYGREYTYLPLKNICEVHWQSDPRHAAVFRLSLETSAGPLFFLFTSGNPFLSAYKHFLESLPAASRRREQPASVN